MPRKTKAERDADDARIKQELASEQRADRIFETLNNFIWARSEPIDAFQDSDAVIERDVDIAIRYVDRAMERAKATEKTPPTHN